MATENNKQVLNAPNLRFPEFTDEWKEEELSQIADISKGEGISKEQLSEDGKPCILYGELYTKYKSEIINEVLSKTNIDSTGLKKSKANDVIIPCSGETAIDIATARCVPFDDILLGGDLNVIRPHQYNGAFMSYQLNGKRKYDIARVAQGVSVVHLYGEHLNTIITYNPCVNEQERITAFLSLIDKRIATQSEAIKDLNLLKGAVIDQLILQKPRNAEMGQVCSIGEQIKVVADPERILTVRLKSKGICWSQAENLELGATQYYKRKAGQLIYGKQNFHNGAIDIVPQCFDGGITSKDIPSFDINSKICNPQYLLAQISSPKFYKPVEALTTGTGSKRLHENNFLKIPIVLPSLEEQNRITALIKNIDHKLTNEEKYYNLLCRQKNYFLQNMFI